MLDEREKPHFRILRSLLETAEAACSRFCAYGICDDAAVGELALLWLQPSGMKGVVRKNEDPYNSNDERNGADLLSVHYRHKDGP